MAMALPGWRCRSRLATRTLATLALALSLTFVKLTAFAGASANSNLRHPGARRAAIQEKVADSDVKLQEQDPARLEFETYKFNLAWTKMKQAEEEKSPDLPELRKEVEDLAKVVESLGGSKPAEMMTLDEAERKVREVREDLSFQKLWSMTNEERWLLAQGLGPAFPISLILSYTLYWTLNIPFISYAYYTTVLTGAATMSLVMAGAYTASIPFKPLIYIGAILFTPWVADNDILGKTSKNFKEPSTPTTSTLPTQDVKRRFFKLFRLPDERELNEM